MKRIYEFAPMSGRSAISLANTYGFGTVENLAQSIPENGTVIDVGAGASPFGCEVARLREDVTWVNTDLCFDPVPPRVFEQFVGDPPKNLQYVRDDILQTKLETESADLVFSTALLPHIIMSSRKRGRQAVHNMAGLLKGDGTLCVSGFGTYGNNVAVATAEAYRANPQEEVAAMISAVALRASDALVQRFFNLVPIR